MFSMHKLIKHDNLNKWKFELKKELHM